VIPGAAFVPGSITPVAITRVHSAIRLGGLILALATVMLLTPLALPVAMVVLGLALRWTGMFASEQGQLIKPWWPMAAIVLVVHTVTGCLAAGQLVAAGVISGLLSFFLRVTSLEDTIDAVHFWLKPLHVFGVKPRNLGLVLAVALGTAPVVMEEGKRIRAVVRMRQAEVASPGLKTVMSRWWRSLLEWGHVVLPVMESLGRRADNLTLSLATRMPVTSSEGNRTVGPGLLSFLVLGVWLVALLWFAVLPEMRGWH